MAKSSPFRRELLPATIQRLQGTELFKRLQQDILTGDVFPAIRANESVNFYHRGGRLFTFNGTEFRTHIKYASVLTGIKKNYVSESMLASAKVMSKFDAPDDYKRIKENCWLYSGDEAEGVFEVCRVSSYARMRSKGDVVVLDIEVALSHETEGESEAGAPAKMEHKIDRLDLVLLHTKERRLRFYEAKLFANSELWSSSRNPAVAKQLGKYDEQIRDRYVDILGAYRKYVKSARALFVGPGSPLTQLPEPEVMDPQTVLLVFGFDSNQNKKVDELVKSQSLPGRPIRPLGSLHRVTADMLWKDLNG